MNETQTIIIDEVQNAEYLLGYDLIINRLDMIFLTLLLILGVMLFNLLRRSKDDFNR